MMLKIQKQLQFLAVMTMSVVKTHNTDVLMSSTNAQTRENEYEK